MPESDVLPSKAGVDGGGWGGGGVGGEVFTGKDFASKDSLQYNSTECLKVMFYPLRHQGTVITCSSVISKDY